MPEKAELFYMSLRPVPRREMVEGGRGFIQASDGDWDRIFIGDCLMDMVDVGDFCLRRSSNDGDGFDIQRRL